MLTQPFGCTGPQPRFSFTPVAGARGVVNARGASTVSVELWLVGIGSRLREMPQVSLVTDRIAVDRRGPAVADYTAGGRGATECAAHAPAACGGRRHVGAAPRGIVVQRARRVGQRRPK